MKKHPCPEPLNQSREYGAMLHAARETNFDSTRLAAVRRSIGERIKHYERRPAQHRDSPSAWLFAAGKRRAVVLVSAALLILSTGAAAYTFSNWKGVLGWFAGSEDSGNQNAAKEDALEVASSGNINRHGFKSPKQKSSDMPQQTTIESLTPLSPVAKERISSQQETAIHRATPKTVSPPRTEKRRGMPAGEKKQNALWQEIELFNEAKELASAGRHVAALETLNQLNSQYPDTRLRADANRLKLGCLYRLKRYSEATVVVRQLIADPAMAGKKAEHLRILGDLQIHQGQCDLAVQNFQRALGLGITGSQAEAAQNGIKKCNTP